MKTKTILILLVLGAAGPLMAGNEPGGTSATAIIRQATFRPLRPQPESPAENRDGPRNGPSSRPWTQSVGWHPGEPSVLMDARIHEPKFNLLQLSFGPHPEYRPMP